MKKTTLKKEPTLLLLTKEHRRAINIMARARGSSYSGVVMDAIEEAAMKFVTKEGIPLKNMVKFPKEDYSK